MSGFDQGILKAILSVSARQAFLPARVAEIVLSRGGIKQFQAYNLCDGTRSSSEIAKQLKLDPANFWKTVTRWVDAGILFRLSEGNETKLLHIYILSSDFAPKGKNK